MGTRVHLAVFRIGLVFLLVLGVSSQAFETIAQK
jgi:hypothetical protein